MPFLWAGETAALPAKAFDPVVEVMIVICAVSSNTMQVTMDDGKYSKIVMLFQEKRAQKKGFLSTMKNEIWPPMPSTV